MKYPVILLFSLLPSLFLVACSSGGGSGDSSTDSSTDDSSTAESRVRFVVLGDVGEGNAAQAEVATAMKNICADLGCDFAVLLGDNFYDTGVTSAADLQFDTKFETPYADLDFDFYPVLGEADYGGVGSLDFVNKGGYQVAYTASSTKWKMPDTHHSFARENAGFVFLDTTSLLHLDTTNGDQNAWIGGALASLSTSDWIFVFGHHTYRSGGQHGNAGNYEGLGAGTGPIFSGENFKTFVDSMLCGSIHFYFSGHDHNLQLIRDDTCGIDIAVSGAGAKTTNLVGRGENEIRFEDDSSEGFMWVEVTPTAVNSRFYDKAETMIFERTVTK